MLINKIKPFLLTLDLQHFSDPNNPPADPPPSDPPNPEPETFSKDYVEKLRKEAASYRTKAKDLEADSKTQQQAMLNKVFEALGINPDPNLEFEKQLSAAQKTAQEAEKRANDKLIRAEIKSIGAGLGIIDPDVAYLLVGKESLVIKEDGSVEGVKEALEQVIQEKPYLVGSGVPGEQPKPTGYKPGSTQRGNNPKPEDDYQAGVDQFERLKKAGKIKF